MEVYNAPSGLSASQNYPFFVDEEQIIDSSHWIYKSGNSNRGLARDSYPWVNIMCHP
jgi:hypothetical protein